MTTLRIGTAGWAIPRAVADAFPAQGSGLERYAARFNALEINSTFYRSHRPATWARWRDGTPADLRFSLKAPRTITHERKLIGAEDLLAAFLAEARQLEGKLGPILVQLPPSLAFDPAVTAAFLQALRARHTGPVAWEPRHASWFDGEADALLAEHTVARVAADPARTPQAAEPAGFSGLRYWRLHGSPRMYYSAYDEAYLAALAERLLADPAREVWCVFDNTTSGAAAANALRLLDLIRP